MHFSMLKTDKNSVGHIKNISFYQKNYLCCQFINQKKLL